MAAKLPIKAASAQQRDAQPNKTSQRDSEDAKVPSWRRRLLFRCREVAHVWGRFLHNLGRDFVAHNCPKSAAALTYMTLFAIVPLMTVMYSVFSMVPAFDGVGEKLQSVIFEHFVPESGSEVQSYLSEFSSQARSLTGFGVLMLVITAYLMLTNIEKTFNDIWGVDRARRGLSSFLLYWAVLSIGPILLGSGIAVSTYLLSHKLFVDEFESLGVIQLVLGLLPLVMTAAAFTLLFAAVPNCRVPMRYAMVGGLVTAIAFEIIKEIFSNVVANSNFQLVYGAFAAVPLFLLWINLMWTILLVGAILVRTLAERHYILAEGKQTDMVAALKCLALFQERAEHGDRVSDNDCYRLGIGVVHWQKLRNRLYKFKWITTTSSGHYVLCRDMRLVTLWDLSQIVELRLHDLNAKIAHAPDTPWYQEFLQRRGKVVASAEEAFGVTVEELLAMDEGRAEQEVARVKEEEERGEKLVVGE